MSVPEVTVALERLRAAVGERPTRTVTLVDLVGRPADHVPPPRTTPVALGLGATAVVGRRR